jgi:SNF2 family DNA or RNA helicase
MGVPGKYLICGTINTRENEYDLEQVREYPGVTIKKRISEVPFNILFSTLVHKGMFSGGWNRGMPDRRFHTRPNLGSDMVKPWVRDILMPHQKRALEKSLTKGGFNIWAPPGAGKTLCGLIWLANHPRHRLVVTKAAARGTWREEARKYTDFNPIVLKGHNPEECSEWRGYLAAKDFAPSPYRRSALLGDVLFIVGWETLIHWADVIENQIKPYGIVFDEIHHAKGRKRWDCVVSEYGEKEFRLKRNMAAAAMRVSHAATARLGLTATPIPNRPCDLWAQLDLVEPYQWGKFHDFGVRYCAGWQDAYGWKYDGLSQEAELAQRLSWVKHKTNRKSVVANLPPIRRQVVHLGMEEQCRPTGGFKQEIRRASKSNNKDSVFEVLLQEAASRKRRYVLDRVKEAAGAKQKIIVFTGRRKDCERLGEEIEKKLPAVQVWAAHGGDSTDARDEIRRRYMDHPGPCVLVGTGDAWGESVNLQDTDLLLISMLPWTPRQIEQWEGRVAGRLGQKRPVLLSYVIASNSADERVAEVLLDKLPAVGTVVGNDLDGFEDAFDGEGGDELLQRLINT